MQPPSDSAIDVRRIRCGAERAAFACEGHRDTPCLGRSSRLLPTKCERHRRPSARYRNAREAGAPQAAAVSGCLFGHEGPLVTKSTGFPSDGREEDGVELHKGESVRQRGTRGA
jgi:hypothetical protein